MWSKEVFSEAPFQIMMNDNNFLTCFTHNSIKIGRISTIVWKNFQGRIYVNSFRGSERLVWYISTCGRFRIFRRTENEALNWELSLHFDGVFFYLSVASPFKLGQILCVFEWLFHSLCAFLPAIFISMVFPLLTNEILFMRGLSDPQYLGRRLKIQKSFSISIEYQGQHRENSKKCCEIFLFFIPSLYPKEVICEANTGKNRRQKTGAETEILF